MKSFAALLLSLMTISVASSSGSSRTSSSRAPKYIISNNDDYNYGYGVAATVHIEPTYPTAKPVYTNTWRPIVGYKPYTGPGSSYDYGYKPSYSTQKPVYVYKPYYGTYNPYYYPYYPYYGYSNPHYYGSYKHGLGYGQIYDYDYTRT